MYGGILAFRMSLLNTSRWILLTEKKYAIFLFRAIFGQLDFLFRILSRPFIGFVVSLPVTKLSALTGLMSTGNIWQVFDDYYRPQTKFAKVMFSQAFVILSTGRGGGVCIQGGVYIRGVGQTPHRNSVGYSQRADGTHHTGMHSCS